MNAAIKYVVVGLVCLALGFWGGSSYQSSIGAPKAVSLATSALDSITITGLVEDIRASSIVVKIAPMPSGDSELREVLVFEETKIVRNVLKSPDQIAMEQTEFQKKAAELNARGEPITGMPTTFREEEIDLADIKVGEAVTADSASTVGADEPFKAVFIRVSQPIVNISPTAIQ